MANVFTIPASVPFAETLAHGLIARTGAADNPLALADVTLYLPTRRAARTLNDVFARILGGAALLPGTRPLGDVEEEDFLFDVGAEALTLPPAVSPVRRVLLLATLVQRWDRQRRDGRLGFAQAVTLSRPLAEFLDQTETQGLDLEKLDNLAPAQFARHWNDVKTFLEVIRDYWPKVLAEEAAMNPAARRDLALRSLAKRLETNPPRELVVGAGSTGSIPATAELLRVIANLPRGFVVLPGLDKELDEESWNSLDAGHPQHGLKQLLYRMQVLRSEVADFDSSFSEKRARETLVREVLRPAPTTDAWRALAEGGGGEIAEGLEGLSLVEAAHPGEEAASIALMLRRALEPNESDPEKKRTAALITPDRNLARRVAAEMGRWNIEIDDSAGKPLSGTPPGIFLCLVAEAVMEKFAPVPLLALLKHPLACGGQAAADFRRRVRQLERFCLRGPRPDPGLSGIEDAIAAALRKAQHRERKYEVERIAELAYWFKPLAAMLRPLEAALSGGAVTLPQILAAHFSAAEALAASDTESGDFRLWWGDAGEKAAQLAMELQQAAHDLPAIEPTSYPILFRSLAEQQAVRPAYGRHPRISILGPLEARLQSFDFVILGGLNEGSWPRAAGTDPWLSRPMRAQLGLEPPERRIGLSAHDFATLISSPRVILTRALKADGTPTVASRWLQRLQQLTKGLGLADRLSSEIPYASLAAMRDMPDGPPQRVGRPRPCPPVESRPRGLSVTEIETWLRDPYAIYAKHVLHLKPLDPLDAEVGPLDRGSAIHAALEQFLREFETIPEGAEKRLIEIAQETFADAKVPKAALALWLPRFINAAHWFVREERLRRATIVRSHIEIRGERTFDTPAGEFVLRARADRVDTLNGGGAAIVDYKTGNLPSPKQVKNLLSPQLPLEAVIMAGGGFPDVGKATASDLIYIRFGGGAKPGEVRGAGNVAELIAKAEEKLRARLADFARADMPYLSRVMPFRSDQPGDYDHLSRVREWSLSGWDEPEE